MSKRSGAVSPDEYINRYGADVFRMYLGFGFSYRDGGPWSDEGIRAVARFVARASRVVESFLELKAACGSKKFKPDSDMEYVRNTTILEVTKDIDHFEFNTAMARIMEYVNAIVKYQMGRERSTCYEEGLVKDLVLLLAPMAPHYTEEMWERLGYQGSVHNQSYPLCDETKLVRDRIQIPVQVNGTLRDVLWVSSFSDEEGLKEQAFLSDKVNAAVAGRAIQKIIIIKGRLINIVTQ